MSKPDRKDKKGIQRKKSTDGGDSTSDGGTANYRPIIHKPGKKPGIKKLKKRAERTARTAKAQERRKAAELANTPENRRATLLTMAEKFERKAERAAKRAADYRQKAESLSGGANSVRRTARRIRRSRSSTTSSTCLLGARLDMWFSPGNVDRT